VRDRPPLVVPFIRWPGTTAVEPPRGDLGCVGGCGLLWRICRYAVSMPEIPGTLTAALHREDDCYVAQCLEVDVASQGPTIDEALANLAEAVELYLEEVDDPAGQLTATPLVTTFRLPAA
jgi:predicted RNase H-like HicB family nuclease